MLRAVLASQKVRMILALVFLMDQTLIAWVTVVALVTTQQTQLVLVGTAPLPS